MGRVKKTVTYRDIFGNKNVETRWGPEGSGCGSMIVLFVIVYFFLKGCN